MGKIKKMFNFQNCQILKIRKFFKYLIVSGKLRNFLNFEFLGIKFTISKIKY